MSLKSRLNCPNSTSGCRNVAGRLFHTFGPATKKLSEPSVTGSSWDSEGIGVSRAKTAVAGVSDKMAVIHEVRSGFTAQRIEDFVTAVSQ